MRCGARRVQPGIVYECFMSFCNTKNIFSELAPARSRHEGGPSESLRRERNEAALPTPVRNIKELSSGRSSD